MSLDILRWSNLEKCFNYYINLNNIVTCVIVFFVLSGQKNDEITYASVVLKSHNCHDSEGNYVSYVVLQKFELFCLHCSSNMWHQTVSLFCETFFSLYFLSSSSSVLPNNDPINSSASELVSSETVLYATVKQRESRWASEQRNIQIQTLKKKKIFLWNSHLVLFDLIWQEVYDVWYCYKK